MKKYLISGIPPSYSGVGYLMENLKQIAEKYNYEVIYPKHINQSIRTLLFNPIKVMYEVLRRYKSKSDFTYKVNALKNSEVILIHPQTIGFKTLLNIIDQNDIVKNYIMDNSFFCIKSYNTLNQKECLKCLNNINNCDVSCQPFPVKYKKNENLKYLYLYKKYSSKILFYAQNKSQKDLLKLHFGSNINIKTIGLKTNEVFEKNFLIKSNIQYDIVYHGANHEAKGIIYVLKLAAFLKTYKILIPEKKKNIKYSEVFPKNIIFKEMNWNNGLKEAVINAKLVLNPSIWSAPIEGALLKSIYYNGNVGIPNTKYGFANDIPKECILHLSNDIEESSKIIDVFLENKKDLSVKSQKWLTNFLKNECDLDKLFTQ